MSHEHSASDPVAVLTASRHLIESSNPESHLDPGKFGAPFNIAGLLATLEKYGPGIVASLAPLAGGLTAATAAAVVVDIIKVIANGGTAAAVATDPAS